MSVEINMKPEQLWSCFHNRINRFKEEIVEIASNWETGTAVFLTEEDTYPYIYVYRNDKCIYDELIASEGDALYSLERIYNDFLYPPHEAEAKKDMENGGDDSLTVVTGGDDDIFPTDWDINDPDQYDTLMDMMYERENEICCAFEDLIAVLAQDRGLAEEMFGDSDLCDANQYIIDKIIQFLAINCGICIYRPTIIFDEDVGEEVFSEYPYEDYDFGEENLDDK